MIILLAGGVSSAGETEEIVMKADLTVHLYNSIDELRTSYMYRNGDIRIKNKIKGFYSDGDNSIHCMKWDFFTCGHELYHALQYKGDKTLLAEKGFEHFKENNYTSQ